jgi:hypothetical protein
VDDERCTIIPAACFSLFGTIQPDFLSLILKPQDLASGFLPRVLCSVTESGHILWTEDGFDAAAHQRLYDFAVALFGLGSHTFDASETVVVDTNAKNLFISWFNKMSNESWTNADETAYRSFIRKMIGQCLRMGLQLHALETVEGLHPLSAPLSLNTMQNAIRVIEWFKFSQKQICSYVSDPSNYILITPFQRDVATVLASLCMAEKVDYLPTSKITEKLNNLKNTNASIEDVGKACRKLGLVSHRTASERGFKISRDNVIRFAKLIGQEIDEGPTTFPVKQDIHSPNKAGAENSQQEPEKQSVRKNPTGGWVRRIFGYTKTKLKEIGTGRKPRQNTP